MHEQQVLSADRLHFERFFPFGQENGKSSNKSKQPKQRSAPENFLVPIMS